MYRSKSPYQSHTDSGQVYFVIFHFFWLISFSATQYPFIVFICMDFIPSCYGLVHKRIKRLIDWLVSVICSSDDFQKMSGQPVHNANQFGSAWAVSDGEGPVSLLISVENFCFGLRFITILQVYTIVPQILGLSQIKPYTLMSWYMYIPYFLKYHSRFIYSPTYWWVGTCIFPQILRLSQIKPYTLMSSKETTVLCGVITHNILNISIPFCCSSALTLAPSTMHAVTRTCIIMLCWRAANSEACLSRSVTQR